ncbi:MAG: CDP-alcohol phosphatidyltransferase family protein, partial [Candidatus Cloacimonadota bacterium]|nr:CDP-alcohol phosphatidyltransferase family protein [Candidatus Cloacimonadota bacterium]
VVVHLAVLIIIVVREIAVTLLRNYYAKKNIFIPANIWGKVKTTFQLTAIIASLVFFATIQILNAFTDYSYPNIYSWIEFGLKMFFWLVALITILSGITYFFPKGSNEK